MQCKGEAERALLCKLWGGTKEVRTYYRQEPGVFHKTSMSTCIFIQPQPFLSELMALNGDNGLIGRSSRQSQSSILQA